MSATRDITKGPILVGSAVRRSVQKLYEFRRLIPTRMILSCANDIYRPKKVKREPDPEVLRRVEEKIAALNIQE